MLDNKAQSTMMLKLKLVLLSNSIEMVISDPKEMLGILDLKSVGYYKIKQGILQQNLRR